MKVKIVLDLKNTSNALILVDADHYTQSMTNNPFFTDGLIQAQVKKVQTATTALRTAMNASTSDTKTDNIRIARDTLDRELTSLASLVENVANDPKVPDANRVSIVHSAGMEVKETGTAAKKTFTAKCGTTSGTAVLIAAGSAISHEWKGTTDIEKFTNCEQYRTTAQTKTEITGLTKRTDYAFFHRPVLRNEETDWEGPVFLFVL